MNSGNTNRLGFFKSGVVILLAWIAGSQAAYATLAATHKIENSVTVSYDDAGGQGNYSATDSVQVIVNLVEAAPDVVALATTPTNLDPGPVSTNITVTLPYQITSNANGLDTYTFDFTITATDASFDPSLPADFGLGGTSFGSDTPVTTLEGTDVAAGTTPVTNGTLITVPADGTGGDGAVSGFVVGDTIVLDASTGGEIVCKVNGIDEPTVGNEANATASILVDECSVTAGLSLEAGDQIGERVTINVTVDSGTTTETVTVSGAVESTTDTNESQAVSDVDIVVVAADLDVYKYVRNTNAANNPSSACNAPFDCLVLENGATDITYYRTGVTADPGETLEYAVLLLNNTSEVTNVVTTDDIPTFTSLVTTPFVSVKLIPVAIAEDIAGTFDCANASSTTCYVNDGAGTPGVPTSVTSTLSDFAGYSAPTLTVSGGHNGDGSTEPANTSGGTLDTSATANQNPVSVVVYQVNLDN